MYCNLHVTTYNILQSPLSLLCLTRLPLLPFNLPSIIFSPCQLAKVAPRPDPVGRKRISAPPVVSGAFLLPPLPGRACPATAAQSAPFAWRPSRGVGIRAPLLPMARLVALLGCSCAMKGPPLSLHHPHPIPGRERNPRPSAAHLRAAPSSLRPRSCVPAFCVAFRGGGLVIPPFCTIPVLYWPHDPILHP